MKNKDYYYVEALIKKESSTPDFETIYEWLILQIENLDEDDALKKANDYLNVNYNRIYQGGVPIKLSVVKILSISPSLESIVSEVMEIYSLSFNDINSFENWRDKKLIN